MKLLRGLAFLVGFLPALAVAQQFPVVPDHSVIGRVGPGSSSGPSQAIPFTQFLPTIVGAQSANLVFAGPSSGGNAAPAFRSLVGADLPAPGASSLGGVQSKTCTTSNWFNTLSTGGVFGCSQPAFTDITGSITSAQCVAATSGAIGCVKPDGTTITVSGGVITAVSGTAASVDAAGATAVTNCGTANAVLINTSSNKVGCVSGGWILLTAPLVASNSATLSDTTHITGYVDYKLVFENIVPATTSVSCEIQVHTNGAFQTTGYSSNIARWSAGTVAASSSTTFIGCDAIAGTLVNSGPGVSGEIILYNAAQTTSPKNWAGMFSENATNIGSSSTGAYTGGNTAIDGFQVLMSSGNITSGSVKIYGRL